VSHVLQSRLLSPAALALLLAIFAGGLAAQPVEIAKPMALRSIMKELDRDMQAVTGAISREEWSVVARLAPKIARHAEPPLTEKMRILGWLGSDAGQFRSLDGQVNEAAMAMEEAAGREDGEGVIMAFSRTQQSCLAGHQHFRHSFVKQFYGTRLRR